MKKLRFGKGHGTENDFVIVSDPGQSMVLTPEMVVSLCDRRTGIGGDGLLRVIQENGEWFMDYRNADGSVAEMCGNGVRVFAHWVRTREGVTRDSFSVGTRAGRRDVIIHEATDSAARVSVDMGRVEVTGVSTAQLGGVAFAGLGVDVGNPHLAAVIPGLSAAELAQMDFTGPVFDTEFFPRGVNIEVLTPLSDGRVHMRVHERGVGETRSCGTGTVAAAYAALADAGQTRGEVVVAVPGGEVNVNIGEDGATLTGPSIIVATGEFDVASL